MAPCVERPAAERPVARCVERCIAELDESKTLVVDATSPSAATSLSTASDPYPVEPGCTWLLPAEHCHVRDTRGNCGTRAAQARPRTHRRLATVARASRTHGIHRFSSTRACAASGRPRPLA